MSAISEQNPGVTLFATLRQPGKGLVTKIAWSPDGSTLAVPTQDGTVEFWDIQTNTLRSKIDARLGTWITSVAWSPDGTRIAVSSGDDRTRIWRVADGVRLKGRYGSTLSLPGTYVAWSPMSGHLATITANGQLRTWDTKEWTETAIVMRTTCMAAAKRGLAVGTQGGDILLVEPQPTEGDLLWGTRMQQPGIRALAFSPDERTLAAGSSRGTICLLDVPSGRRITEFEGHVRMIRSLTFSADGRLLASKSDDGTVRLWDAGSHARWWTIQEPTLGKKVPGYTNKKPPGIAFHPSKAMLATLGNWDRTIRIWNVDIGQLLAGSPVERGIRYTTAKIVLVGDSGVGKTGLGWRLAHGSFKNHPSTHGQQFWVLESLRAVRPDKTECEAVLWDFAGQPDYRLTHALFLDRVDLALVLFDPGNHSEPLKGAEYWLKALHHTSEKPCPKILVAARSDRASPMLTESELNSFCSKHEIQQGFIATSAFTGQGIDELLARMTHAVAWEDMSSTVTTGTFKRIKEYVLSLKEAPSGDILVEPATLQTKLRATNPKWDFSTEEMMTAVHHLANHGYVTVLQSSSTNGMILLFPEVLSNLASSFVLEARRNPAGLGALDEARILRGDYSFPEVTMLSPRERDILLDAVTALFLQRNICFRERLGSGTYLIFPSLINQKKPSSEQVDTAEDVSYTVTGRVENVYAALVVLLGYSNSFTRTNQWQNQAEYEMNPGEVCGFKQITDREGEIDLVHYYGSGAGSHVRSLFQGLFESFLLARDVAVTKYPPVACPYCSYRPERVEIIKRIKQQKTFLYCGECSKKIMLPSPTIEKAGRTLRTETVTQDQEAASNRTRFETALTMLKGVVRDSGAPSTPTCFISYAWGIEKHERWVLRLGRDLENADVNVLIDRKNNAALGSSIARFVNEIEKTEFVIVVGTPEYLVKYKNLDSERGTFVSAEMDILNQRLTGTNRVKDSVIPVLLAGDPNASFPPLLKGRVYADLIHEDRYLPGLFDLVLALYRIKPDAEYVQELRQSLSGDEEDVG